VRVESDAELRYQFDNLDPAKAYDVHFSFWLGSGSNRVQQIQIDGANLGSSYTIVPGVRQDVTVSVPRSAYYDDGRVVVGLRRTNATTGAFVNTIALEERTIPAPDPCQVQESPAYTEVYGTLALGGAAAPVGTVVKALNPRGDTVGCWVVNASGQYGLMRIYGENTQVIPATPGMRDGEEVEFRVNDAPVIATIPWRDDRAAHQVNLEGVEVVHQSLLIRPGWNLISFYVEPIVLRPERVLRSIAGRYDLILCDGTIYGPSLPPDFITLTELHGGVACYLHATSPTAMNLVVEGTRIPVTTPIALKKGWNWHGYLPGQSLPVAEALQSISGKYTRLLSIDRTHDVSLPTFSSLTRMEPGQGYLIYMTQDATLVYPAIDAARVQSAPQPTVSQGCDNVAPTPALTLVYGDVRISGQAAVPGTKVEALAPDGTLTGCFVVQNEGEFGLMHVYGAWTEEEAGLRAGEPIGWRVNGVLAQAGEAILWQDDRTPHRLELDGVHPPLFLPLIQAEPATEASSSEGEQIFLPAIDR
jgi:hypothetical protein